MSKTIRVAAIQMNATPAACPERLARAGRWVAQAARAGAQLVVLPEVFNTGYEYSPQNYTRAETLDGPAAAWMRSTAARYRVHLAGTFLRREKHDIYNSLLLAAPDGREWRYDKRYPWFWERAYFRPGSGVTIADTDLGKIGMLICWDAAHVNLWRQYAGRVQLLVICSCPPRAFDMALVSSENEWLVAKTTGRLIRYLKRSTDGTFGEYLRRQAGFLGVPLVQATSTGTFRSSFPNPRLSLLLLALVYPPLWKSLRRFEQARMESEYFNETYLADAGGNLLQQARPGKEACAIGTLDLPGAPPQPHGKQPPFGIPVFAYWFDGLANLLFAREYRKRTREMPVL